MGGAMTSAAKQDNGEDDKVFADELAPGTQLLNGAYVIERFLNSGGFGITYLAKDSLDRSVVIKECFPGSFCRRSNTIVGARSRAHQNEFKSIVKLFVQEARSLSKLKHPNIVGVHQVFEDNDTAYMALDYVEGNDLLDILEDPKRELGPEQIQHIMAKILDAVAFIHDQGVLHRDISPDNILIDSNDNPVLIDFGAAREEATKASRVLSALRVVKDGYSPQEFYIQGSDQAPSSDLYALGASFFHLITGETPPNSQNRLAAIAAGDKDPYQNLAGRVDGYDKGFLEAIDKALNVFPKDRIQSAADWLKMIGPIKPAATVADTEKTVVEMVSKAADTEAKQAGATDAAAGAAAAKAAVAPKSAGAKTAPAVAAAAAAAPKREEPKSKMGLLLGSVAAVALIAGIAATQFGGGEEVDVADDTAVEQTTVVATETTGQDAPADQVDTADPVEEVTQRDDAADPVIAEADAAADAPVVEPSQSDATIVPDASAPQGDETDLAAADAIEPDSLPDVAEPGAEEVGEQTATELALVDPNIAQPQLGDEARLPTSNLTAGENDTQDGEELALPTPEQAPEPQAETEPEPEVIAPATFDETPPELVTNLVRPIARPDSDAAVEIGVPADAEVARPDLSALNAAPAAGGDVSGIDTQTAVPTPDPVFVEEPSVLELTAVMSGWSTPVPFSGGDTPGVIVENVDPSVSDWLEPGQEIVRVNGLRISSIDQVEKVVRSTTELTDQAQVEAQIAYRKEDGGPVFEQDISLDVVREVALLNGTRFQITREGDGWKTVVTESSDQGDGALLPGDEVVSYIRTSVPIDGPTSLQDLLEAELAEGQKNFNFAVLRDGSTWLASLNYEAAIDN